MSLPLNILDDLFKLNVKAFAPPDIVERVEHFLEFTNEKRKRGKKKKKKKVVHCCDDRMYYCKCHCAEDKVGN